MVRALTHNVRDVCSIPALGAIFLFSSFPPNTHTQYGRHHHDPVQAMHCMLVKPTLFMYLYVKTYNSRGTGVVVCTDLSGKEQYRQVGLDRVVTSGNIGGVVVSTLVWNARSVGVIPALGTIIPIFITPTNDI